MKYKNTFFLIFTLFFLNCVQEENREIIKPRLKYQEALFNIDTIFNLDNYKTLKEFNIARYKVNKFGRFSAVNLKIASKNYIINLQCIPDNCFIVYPLKAKNVLLIYKDSIVKPSTFGFPSLLYPSDSLENVYEKDILNYGSKINFSNSPEHLILAFQYGDLFTISELKTMLKRIVNSYLKINKDSLPLNLSISYKPPILPPSLD